MKAVPELLPTDNEENEVDDINWPEYLTQDLPQQQYSLAFSSDSDLLSTVRF